MADDDATPEFEQLLGYLRDSRGFDFTGYKRPSLRRRIDKQMRAAGVAGYSEYVDLLEVHPAEFGTLFNSILINVTAFFRDPAAWTYLLEVLLPRRLAEIGPDRPFRVWSAGCASGEEPCTIAMLLAELLGPDEFARRVKIYGTDIDDDALQSARRASYPAAAIDAVPDEFRDKYFEKVDDRFVFRPQLRSSMVFGHLDVLRDAPISRLEMLACRNTLMYFNAETQAQVIARFHFALNEGGLLMVGKAETLLSHGDLFKPFDRKLRVFRRVTGPADPDGYAEGLSVRVTPAASRDAITLPASFFDVLSVAALLFDANGVLVEMSERARSVFGFTGGERGTLLQDLDLSYRPIDLRTPVNQVLRERRSTTLPPVEWTVASGALRTFEIEIVPLLDGRVVVGAGLVFHDRTEHQRVEDKLKLSAIELEQAYQAVQSANEELETTNEELQSTIEELETTNEELQSTNEELETTNEELHSTNDELHSVNEEVRLRGDQVDALNRFLQAILTSVRGAVVLIDSGRRVLAWNDQAADLWGLRQDEVTGSDFFSLDIGLPTAELRPALRATLEGRADREQVELDAVDRRGRRVRVRVSITPLRTDDAPLGAMLTMEVLPENDPQ